MRPSTMLATGLIGLAGATVACAPSGEFRGPRDPPGEQDVFVITNCTGEDVTIRVRPPRVRVRKNTDTVAWHVAAQTVRIVIEPKSSRWPFASSRHTGDRLAPARSGPVDDSADRSPYPYKVTATCETPAGDEVTVILDPDIIIMF